MFIAIPAAVDNNGAATLDASLSVDNTIEDNISNVRSTASESGPEFLIGLSGRLRVFRIVGEEETRGERVAASVAGEGRYK